MAQIANSDVRFAVGTGDTAYPSGTQTNYGDLRPDGLGRQRHLRAAALGEGRRLDPVLQRGGQPRLQQHVPVDVAAGERGRQASGGRYAMDTYCCPNGTNSAALPERLVRLRRRRRSLLCPRRGVELVERRDGRRVQERLRRALDPGSPEYQWLANDLRSHPSQLKFAFFHYPMYSSNATESSDSWLRGPGSLEGLLARNGVAIGFSGHAHNYTRNDEAGRRPGHLRHRRRRRAAAAGHEVRRAGGVRDRVVVHDRRERLRQPRGPRRSTRCSTSSRSASTAPRSRSRPPTPRAARSTSGPTTLAADLRHRRRRHHRRRGRRAGGQATAGGSPASASSLTVPIASGAGHALVATIAVQAGRRRRRSREYRLCRERVDQWTGGPPRRLEHAGGDLALDGRRPGVGRDGEPLGCRHRQR